MLYRVYIESPDIANMIGIYPKTDSSHGYGNPSTSFMMQSHTKCTEISRRTLSIVMVLSECGWLLFAPSMWLTQSIPISYLGIGIKLPPAKTDKKNV